MLRYFDVPGFGEGGTVAFAAFSVLGHVDALAATARQDYCSHERNDDNSDMLFHVLLTRLPFIYFGCPKKNVKKEYTSAKMRRLAESVEMTETADANICGFIIINNELRISFFLQRDVEKKMMYFC